MYNLLQSLSDSVVMLSYCKRRNRKLEDDKKWQDCNKLLEESVKELNDILFMMSEYAKENALKEKK
jgi:hypothetical protein